jgi:acyl transferase domain-containing protein/acyl carrier protein
MAQDRDASRQVDLSASERDNNSTNAATAEEIQAWLTSCIAERLEIEPQNIGLSESFVNLGLSSIDAVSISGEMEEWLGRRLSPTFLYEYPNILTISRFLAIDQALPKVRSKADDNQELKHEPIAIIGIGCRFPGCSGPGAFWRLLCDGIDAISEVPAERWDWQTLYDLNPETPGKMNTYWGGFLEEIDRFDPGFFGISPREAARMDPQQRLLLEVAWEALEDGGQVVERLGGTKTGVFIGISSNDYGHIQFSNPEIIDAYAGTGNALSIAANRISYLFNFRGPSMATDTACSSSLVAVHLACQSLLSGESTMALAGGVNLIISPAITLNFTKAGVMAPDGRCKAFDARANGYVRGEGAGIVVLKPLSMALADGDPIYALIKGTAVNQDGRTNGLMAPSRQAQEEVLRTAYQHAGISPGQVAYVEAHGTGTLLGDPIEAAALGTVLSIDRPTDSHCAVGSVKTNIGHLEAAAGIAGLIKVALSLKHKMIPPSLHFQTPNPHIDFATLSLDVQQTLSPWPNRSGSAIAGVSSFGFGGTNAHAVLTEAKDSLVAQGNIEESDASSTHILPLSGHSAEALESLVKSYLHFLQAEEPAAIPSLDDLTYTASVRRSHHNHRLAVIGRSRADIVEQLRAFLKGEIRSGIAHGRRAPGIRRKIAFVFPGQGAQWLGMGRTLLKQETVFREVIERCDQIMRQHGDWSLMEELTTDEDHSRLEEIDIIQPTLFAIQTALAALWQSWGVTPDAVIGHSMGEVAAAYVARALSLEDAVSVICIRSRLLKQKSGEGAMAFVDLSLEQSQDAILSYKNLVSIAASNSPTSTILSGNPTALAELMGQLQHRNIFCRSVKVDVASHSPQMDDLRANLLPALQGIRPRRAAISTYSTVTGAACDGLQLDATYWMRNLREPVLFSMAALKLAEDGHQIFLEISPHPLLLESLTQCLTHSNREGIVLPSLRRAEDEREMMFRSLGTLYVQGVEVDWAKLYPFKAQCVRLPLLAGDRKASASISQGASSPRQRRQAIASPPRAPH